MHLSYLKGYAYYQATSLVTRFINWRSGPVRDILYIRLDHLGDAILSLPVLENVHLLYPDCPVDVLVSPETKGIYEDIPYVRTVHAAMVPRYHGRAASQQPGLFKKLRKQGYGLIVDVRGDWQTLKLALNLRTRRRLDDGGLRLLYVQQHKLGGVARNYHELTFNLELVRRAGIPVKVETPQPYFSTTKLSAIVRRLTSTGKAFAVVHPFAGWQYREWPGERFRQIIEFLVQRGLMVCVVGSQAEYARTTNTFKFSGNVVLTGELPVRDLYYLISQSMLFIGNDSGPMHLAAAAGVPVVALFGPNLPQWFGPISAQATTHYHATDCSPCDQRSCRYKRPRCMAAITVDEVRASIDKILGEKDADRG
jgi:ADP-heptose:LPS heptosyltransferase